MPKSKNRKKKGRGKRPQLNVPSMDAIRELAKQLDSPELREIYRLQKVANPDLDTECDEMSDEIEEIFKHVKDSY